MSPRTVAQNKQRRLASKQKILAAAFSLIAKNGYEGTSIAQIAGEAGVSKGLLYNYFDSKEELVKTLVVTAMEEGDKIFADMFCEDPRITLKNLFHWFFKEMRERHDYWRLITELTFKIEKFDFVHDLAVTKMHEYVGLLESLLAQIGYKNALGEARIIAALFDGIGIEALVLKDDYPLAEMEEYLINKYCHED
jgi:AcrR family transcriptional regulator